MINYNYLITGPLVHCNHIDAALETETEKTAKNGTSGIHGRCEDLCLL